MRKLEKLAEPAILAKKAATWTAALQAVIASGKKPSKAQKSKYRHVTVKACLVDETGGKCAYCESKFLHVHHGDVEHIYPKSLDPALTFQWDNLTLSCEICNQNKTNLDPFLNNIIDPYDVDPSQHLIFFGPHIFSRGTAAGTSTATLLDLQRPELVARRVDDMNRLWSALQNVFRTDIPIVTRRSILIDLVQNETKLEAQFSAMHRSILAQAMQLLPPEVIENVQMP